MVPVPPFLAVIDSWVLSSLPGELLFRSGPPAATPLLPVQWQTGAGRGGTDLQLRCDEHTCQLEVLILSCDREKPFVLTLLSLLHID